ncbi:MAG TPA: L-seryl-tRNA(Sec) selenium transferase [Nitratidesulfovibrio sp.]|nr:L-seryl-tRNA(Sec) selenium transferase [Nitratidesulfovibrio sp.]
MSNLFRSLPSMDALLTALAQPEQAGSGTPATVAPISQPDLAALPRPLLRDLINAFLDQCRAAIRAGDITDAAALSAQALLPALAAHVLRAARPHFRRVLNATGVVIHTNLGRSLLAEEATATVAEACAHYSNLEFDLATGERGSRYSHVEELLCKVTGAEAGLVVNNNAAAVLLVLDTLCKGGEVVVSRGQLVEIGGSFRIPEVMEKSGAVLREVGATNRTHLRDYENAINEHTVALLKVHTSNYRITGFHKEVPLAELVALGRARNLPVIEDLGSGSFLDFSPWGLHGEPTVREVVADGADVVSFSGDKVLGGPQAGLIVGRREIIARIKRNPLNRALRIDKMTLAALEATLRLYLDPELARRKVPTLRMMTAPADELAKRARKMATRLRAALGDAASIGLAPGMSRVGGGSFPERDLPTTLVSVAPAGCSATTLKERLLDVAPPALPLVGRLEDDTFRLDPRTLDDTEFPLVTAALAQALGLPRSPNAAPSAARTGTRTPRARRG